MKKIKRDLVMQIIRKYLWCLAPIVQTVLVIMLYAKVETMGIFPAAYWVLGILFFVLFNGLLLWLNNSSFRIGRIIINIVSAIISFVLLYGLIMLGHVSKTINEIVVEDNEKVLVSILVRADSDIESIENLSGLKIGIIDDYSVKKRAVEINLQVEERPSYAMYSHFVYQVDALITGTEDAIIVDDAFLGTLEDYENYDEIIGAIRVLDSLEVVEDDVQPAVFVSRKAIDKVSFGKRGEEESGDGRGDSNVDDDNGTYNNPSEGEENSSQAGDSNEPERIVVNTGGIPNSSTGAHTTKLDWSNDILCSGNDTFIIYISGIDTLGDVNTRCRSDVNILAAVNSNTGNIQLISTPRDYYVILPNVGRGDKLTHAGLYGVSNSIAALEKLYGIKVDYYLRMNFTGFVQIIDTIGGIDVWSDYVFTVEPIKTYEVGMNHLNGIEALAFARERYSFSSGDIQRSINQMAVIKAMIGKLSSAEIIYNYKAILDSIANCIQTSMPSEMIYALINRQLSGGVNWQVNTYTTTGFGAYTKTYTSPEDDRYVMVPNDDNVSYAHELIRNVLNN